jgi:hypothetical protein
MRHRAFNLQPDARELLEFERGEALLESVDGEAGLRILRSMADR